MKIIVCENYDEVSEKAAEMVENQIQTKPDSILGLATGSTPLGMYKRLVKMYEAGNIDFSCVTSFNLDEYYPISKSNSQSYDYFMHQNLFSKINIDNKNIHIPNGEAENPYEECENYEKQIKESGGIDLQILGIGQNGHIGFNEPNGYLHSYTHLTELTENTIKANSRFFENCNEVPKKALTMGMSTILGAKKIVILANGVTKSRAVGELMNDEISTNIPATLLKSHPDVVLICDKDAMSSVRLGIDIGGTNIKFAVIDGNKQVYSDIIETSDKAECIVEDIVRKYNKLKDKFHITTVGVGTPGSIIDGLVSSANLPFNKYPLEKLLSQHINIPINIDNDANCAALGELKFGSASDCDNIVLVTIGTGIGGGIIMNKQVCRGKGKIGEIGHMVIQSENGISCKCGRTGCWEQYVSVTALIRDAENAARQNKDSLLYKLYTKGGGSLNGEMIFEALDNGCFVALEVFDKYTDYMAIGLGNINKIFFPDAIILAGGITMQGERLLKSIKEKLKPDIRLEISALQSKAGMLGAAML